jgi:PAS domain S-box-containing protein
MLEQKTATISRLDSIRTRLILSFVLIVLLPMVVISAVLAVSGSKGAQLQLATQLDIVASLKETALNARAATLKAELGNALIGENTLQYVKALVQGPRNSTDYQAARAILEGRFRQLMVQTRRFEALFLMDRNGRVVLSTEASQEGRMYADKAFFRRGLKSPGLSLSPFNRMTIVAARPLIDESGRVIGVLAGPARMGPLHEVIRVPTGLGKTYLVDGNYTLLTALPSSEPGIRVHSEGIEAVLKNQAKGSGAYKDFRGVPVIGAYRWLPELGVALVAEQEQAESLRAVHVLLAVNAGVALAAILIAALASLGVTRSIAVPLADLSETAARIAAGHLDLTADVKRKDEIGALAQTFNFMTDKLRQTMEGIGKSEERFRALYEDNPSMYFTVDENGAVLSVNHFGAEQLGYRIQELVGQSVLDVYYPDDKKPVKQQLAACLQDPGEVVHWELRKVRKDGSVLWVREAARAVRGSDGTEKKFRELFEESKDVVFISSPEGKYIDINRAGVELFGYSSKEESLRIDIARDIYVFSEEREKFQSDLEKYGFVKDYELPLKKKDGEKLNVLITASAVRDEAGKIIEYRGIIRDVTNQRRLEEQLLQAQKMEALGQLSGGIAHDFNNILTAIMGYASLLKSKTKQDTTLQSYVDQVLTASTRARNLTKNLLAFSRRQVLNPRPVNVNGIITGLEKMIIQLIREDIELKILNAAEDLTIMADSGQIEQILINLVTNARDAMPQGGSLTIETKQVDMDAEYGKKHLFAKEGRYACISVTDTGTGMDEKTRGKIFEPFFTTKETGRGTGLGLSIVYGIIKQHNGNINVYSEPGHGTTFRIYFPIIEPEREERRPQELPEPEGGIETLLLAEDDADVRNLTKTILTEAGYTVLEAVDGEDAIKVFTENKDAVQLVLLDVIMPKKNGKEVHNWIKKISPGAKVLFMSGYSADTIFKKGVLEEGLNFLTKPATPPELLMKVREVIDKKSESDKAIMGERPHVISEPVSPDEGERKKAKVPDKKSNRKGSILVVDDDPSVLEYVSLLLEENGYSAYACSNVRDALDKLKDTQVDVVLTDIVMPGTSGLELLETVHNSDPDMPVILVTAYADLGKAVESVKKGAYDFIMKPYEPEQLLRSLDKAVRYRRLVRLEKEYQNKLEEFNKEMETLVAERSMNLMALTVADRVRNPVAVIGLACKKIMDKEVPGELKKYFTFIRDESDKLETMVKSFQNLLGSRRSVFRYENVNEVIKDVISLIEKESVQKGIKLVLHLSEQPLKINMQKDLWRVAVQHILRNAVEATPAGGEIIVTSAAENDNIALSVADTGNGIPQQEIEKIFDPFYSTKAHRYGMGLPLVKQVVSEHMGAIDLTSEPGKGTTFRMVFPSRWQEK